MEICMSTKKPIEILQLQEAPLTALRLLDGWVVITERGVVSCVKGEWTQLYRHPSHIVCGAITPKGIWLGSIDGLWRVEGTDVVGLAASGPVCRLWYCSHKLYVLDGGGYLYSVAL